MLAYRTSALTNALAYRTHLVDFPVVDVDEGSRSLQVLQVDVVDDASVDNHVILE